jgi:DNA-binding Lrp family transcriptional regulator
MISKNGLTGIEKSILSELELDPRIPFSKLGRRIRKSQQNVSYTVNSLIKRG